MIFFSDTDVRMLEINVKSRGNLSVEEANVLTKEVENLILPIEGIRSINSYAYISDRGDQIGQMYLEMFEGHQRRLTGDQIMEQIRQNTSGLAGVKVELEAEEMGPPVGKPVYIEFSSYNKDLLEPAITKIRNFMEESVEGLRDIDDSRDLPGIEFRLNIDKAKASMYGADVSQVGMAVQLITNGIKVGEYRPDRSDGGVDIRVRYPVENRNIQALEDLKIMTNSGLIPITNFVNLEPVQNVNTIRRVNGIPVKEIRANVAPGILADDKVSEIENWANTQDWHPDLNISFRGANEEQDKAADFISVAFGLSLLFMFVLLVTQFNSLYQATLILFAVVLSTAGVLIGLLVTGNAFSSVMTGVGVVALAGIVVNNNIVLIDTFNNLREQYPESDYFDLLVRTGAQRLRPVVLTSATTILGLLPLASNLSIDLINRTIIFGSSLSAFWVPLSQAIVSGLSVATILTLVTTPAMLALPYQLKSFLNRKLNKEVPEEALSS
jgi:multidrug efflux pump